MRDPLFLGIDLGTSGCRAIVIDAAGGIHGEAHTALPAPTRHEAGVEQDPAQWWEAVCRVLLILGQQLDLVAVQAIAVDGTSGTLLLADDNGTPVGPALMYHDTRAQEQANRIAGMAPAQSPVHGSSSTLAKLLWLQEQPGSRKATYALHQADWIAAQFTGRPGISDDNNTLKLGFDSRTRQWPDWMKPLGVQTELLPAVQAPGTGIGNISQRIARQFGFGADTRIIAGTTDSTAAFLATGAWEIGDAVTSLGSTMVLKIITTMPISAPEYGVYSQPFFGRWLAGGASNSGGAVLLQYFSHEDLQRLTPLLDPNHPTGLEYYPLCAPGERFPVNDPNLSPRLAPRPTDNVPFLQAMLEGMTEIEYQGYQRLAQIGAPYPKTLRTVGGGAVNKAWTNMRERRLGLISAPVHHAEAAYGSARLARFGITGFFEQDRTHG